MKKTKIILSAILLSMCIITATGCKDHEKTNSELNSLNESVVSESVPEPYDRNVFALDTLITLRIFGDNAESNADLAAERITELENLLSVTNDESEVSKINSSDGKVVEVNEDTFNVISTASEISELTDGSLDISVYPIVKLWGFTTDKQKVPSKKDIEKELKKVDYSKITLDEENKTVQLDKNMEVDLGAVAKGYISENVKNLLKEHGVEDAVLSFGGNIQTMGTKNGEPWKVGIKYPFTENSFAILSVEETAVVTSATDQRFFKSDGKMYHHIIDPKTGYPVDNGTFSATIVCESGARADALSTAVFVMGIDKAIELYRNSDDFEFVILDDKDNIYVTKGLKDKFRLAANYSELNIEYVEK